MNLRWPFEGRIFFRSIGCPFPQNRKLWLFLGIFLFWGSFLPAYDTPIPEISITELIGLDLNELGEVVVSTPAKTPQKIKNIAGTVRIITAKEIQDRGYSTLEETLSDLPGIQFRNIQGFNSYVFMRGIPNQNNLILLMIDGVQINELNSGGFYGGGQYNLSNVEQIEIVYGPASAIYGTNAVSGVINIITKKAKDSQGFRVSSKAGSFDTQQYDFSLGQYDEQRDLGINVAGMIKKTHKADLRGSRGDNNWSDSMQNFEDDSALDLQVQLSSLTVGLNFQDKETSFSTNQKTFGTLLQDFGTKWHIRFFNTYAKYDYQKSENWSWNSMVYYRDTTVEDDSLPMISIASGTDPGYRERWYRPNHLWGFENRWNRTFGTRLSLTLGEISEREVLSNGFSKSRSSTQYLMPQEPDEPELLKNTLTSGYAQLQYSLSKPFCLTVGARKDDSNVYGKIMTPRMGLVFNNEKLNAKILYSEAFRAPKNWDYRDGLGNPALVPEKMKSKELALGYRFSSVFRCDFAVYRNDLSNCLSRENIGSSWRWENIGRITTSGIEGNLEFHRGKWNSYLNYSRTTSKSQDGVLIPEIAPNTANAGFQYAFSEQFKLNIRGQYLGKRKNTHPNGVSGDYWLDDAFLIHGTLNLANVRGFDVQLAAKNIFNEKYFHTSNTSVSKYRQPQSSLTLQVSKQF